MTNIINTGKKKKLLIILYAHKINDYFLKQYEIDELSKDCEIEIHSFCNIIFKNYSISHKENLINKKFILEFQTISEWRDYIKEKKFNCKKKDVKILILNRLLLNNFLSYLIIFYVKKLEIPILEIARGEFPLFKNLKISKKKIFLNWYKTAFLQFNVFFSKLYILLISLIINKILKYFTNIRPDYLLVYGSKNLKIFKTNNVNIIKSHSFDYSRTIKLKIKKKTRKNFLVYLAFPSKYDSSSDAKFYNGVSHWTKNYFQDLSRFLKFLKKKYNLDIVIALHYKQSKFTRLPYLKKYKHYRNKTLELIKNSKLVITLQSTAMIQAMAFSKPIIMLKHQIYEKFYPSVLYLVQIICKIARIKIVDLNRDLNEQFHLKFKYKKKNYQKYLYSYCTHQNLRSVRNYQIISNLFSKLK